MVTIPLAPRSKNLEGRFSRQGVEGGLPLNHLIMSITIVQYTVGWPHPEVEEKVRG